MSTPELSPELEEIIKGERPLDFDWNYQYHPDSLIPEQIPAEPSCEQLKRLKIVDEGLRDGLPGGPEYPRTEQMLEYVEAANQVGIDTMTVGIFSGDGVVDRTTKSLLGKMNQKYPDMSPIVLSLANDESLKWAAECAAINPNLQVIIFMGSAPSRMLAEGWNKDYVLGSLSRAVKKAVDEYQLYVIGATEHTSQTPPDFLREIIKVQVLNGAKIFCIADTIGTSRPRGSYRIVKFVKQTLKEIGRKDVSVDWHGHRDTGNDLGCAMAAIAAGANRIHVVPWGIGERAGNTNTENLLWNSNQILIEHNCSSCWDLTKLAEYLETYARITGNQIPTYGCLGTQSHTTSAGIHTAAILKAQILAQEAQKNNEPILAENLARMARTVYSAIDPKTVGREHTIEIGPWSGRSTVKLWAMINGIERVTDPQIEKVLNVAKELRRKLSPAEIKNLLTGNGIDAGK